MAKFVSDNDQPIVHHYAGGATVALYPGVEVEADALASQSLRNVSGVREVVEEEPKRSSSAPAEEPKRPSVEESKRPSAEEPKPPSSTAEPKREAKRDSKGT